MRTCSNLGKAILVTASLLTANAALANFTLDSQSSSVNFLSTKNVNVTESHTFDRFSGTVSDAGELTLDVDLTSVNTMIPIRNKRMQSMLFKVSDIATATFTAKIDEALLALGAGETVTTTIEGQLSISGTTKPVSFDVRVTGLKDGRLSASTTKPTVLSASNFGLESGITALKEVAMLQNISDTVPFSFSVVFEKD
ncbi:YceI family protein [Glaciecola siphonariae]|uniref:YceI family protein n=1 Tax=Glaciecola siphonariae TaxID=521012 RepID=A0ABV9LS40_9ALTE